MSNVNENESRRARSRPAVLARVPRSRSWRREARGLSAPAHLPQHSERGSKRSVSMEPATIAVRIFTTNPNSTQERFTSRNRHNRKKQKANACFYSRLKRPSFGPAPRRSRIPPAAVISEPAFHHLRAQNRAIAVAPAPMSCYAQRTKSELHPLSFAGQEAAWLHP